MNRIAFTVEGPCVPCPRPRGKAGQRAYYSQRYTDWKTAAQVAALEACASQAGTPRPCWTGAVELRVIFDGARKNADIDNLVKSAMDAIQGIIIEDDVQVHRLYASKRIGRGVRKATFFEVVGG